MGTQHMDLDTLLDRLTRGIPLTRNPIIPHTAQPNQPRALVLIITHTRCENCGHETTAHNPHMMVRYGERTDHAQSIQHTRADCERFAHLPHERIVRQQTSPYCPECF
jgi:hypothetical protein